MAVIDQKKTTYSDTTPQKRAITDLVDLIDPYDVPVVSYLGLDGNAEAFRVVNWPGTMVEWLQDELFTLTNTLNGSITSDATTITLTDASVFKSGDVIEIDSEMMWMSGKSGEVLTVVRNFGGTQASHITASTVTIINQARLEGDAADYERALVDITAPYNYTSIYQQDIEVSRSANKISQYGIVDEFDYQAEKAIPELTRLIEKGFFRGQRKAGSATTPRSFGGIETFATTSTNLSSAALTQKDLEDLIEDIWGLGGHPDLIICNSFLKRKISGFYAPSVRTERDESRGGMAITSVETDFGTLDILMSRWCPSSKLYVVEKQYLGFLAYEPFFQEPLAKVGDSIRGQVVGEYTLIVRNAGAHGWLYGASITS